jgi:hypothetical protein
MMSKWVIEIRTIGSLLPPKMKTIDGFHYWEYDQAKQIFENIRENLQPIQTEKGIHLPYRFISESEFEYNNFIYTLTNLNSTQMPIIAENNGSNYKIVEAGTYPARCYRMIEVGTVEETFEGKTKTLKKVNLTWELPTELSVFHDDKGEEPFVVSKMFTLSMNEKSTLRKMLEGWRGKAFNEDEAKRFDITVLLGKECLLSIIHKPSKDGSKTYAEISSISKIPKGMTCPPQINPSTVLSFDTWDQGLFESLPEFLQDKIKSSEEYRAMNRAENETEAMDDDHFEVSNAPVQTVDEAEPPF